MTVLKSLEISGYRGFEERQKITFGIPNGIPGSGLTVIVGPNGTGKSSLIEALGWCILIADTPRTDVLNNVLDGEVILENQAGEKILLSGTHGKPLTVVKEFQLKEHEFAYISTEGIRLNAAGDDGILTKNYAEYPDIARLSATSPNLKAKRIRYYIENEGKRESLYSEMNSYFPNFEGLSLQSMYGMNFLKYKNWRGRISDATELGSGFAAISYITSCFGIWANEKPSVVVFEEPELYLHPQFQKKLSGQIRQLSAQHQVVLVTHSPYFLDWSDFDAGGVVVRTNKTKKDTSVASQLGPTQKYYSILKARESDWQRPHLFDVASKEILFGERVLFLEGQEDVGLLRKFASENGIELCFEIFGYGVGGSGNVKSLLQMAADLGLKSGALFDSNAEQEIKTCLALFPSALIKVLPTPDIRDKSSKNLLGVFDESGVIKVEMKKILVDILRDLNSFFSRD